MSDRMIKKRQNNRRVDLLLDSEHAEMLDYINHVTKSPNASATIRALIRREYGKTYVVEGDSGPGGDGRDH